MRYPSCLPVAPSVMDATLKAKIRNSGSAQNLKKLHRGGWSTNKRATGKRSLNAANPTTVDKRDCGSEVTIN